MTTDPLPFREFFRWVDQNKERGICGADKESCYVPPEKLKQYWTAERVSRILNACNHTRPLVVSIEQVVEDFLRVFSILVYMSSPSEPKVSWIREFCSGSFNDKNLPTEDQPSVFPDAPEGLETFREFHKHQFLFCPVSFRPMLHRRSLSLECVLPISLGEPLSARLGHASVLKRHTLHQSSNLTVPGGTIVIKKTSSMFEFGNEVDAYTALENAGRREEASKYFLKYYGSFTQNGNGFILLEYADQGSLLDFFGKNILPYEHDELCRLWENLSSSLFLGLAMLHDLDRSMTRDRLRGVHQDLKPGNVFVFREGEGHSYNYNFKIGDFGLSSINLVEAKSKEEPGPDNKSTKMYGAPELTNRYSALSHIDKGAPPEVDIWSLGCMLIETTVWSICGERGRDEFLAMREQETSKVQRHHDQGYAGCFHDGEKRLAAVDNMFDTILRRTRVFDNLTERIGRFILEEMLRPTSEKRLTAEQLLPRFQDILKTCEECYSSYFHRNPSASIANLPDGRRPSSSPSSAISPAYGDMAFELPSRRSASIRLLKPFTYRNGIVRASDSELSTNSRFGTGDRGDMSQAGYPTVAEIPSLMSSGTDTPEIFGDTSQPKDVSHSWRASNSSPSCDQLTPDDTIRGYEPVSQPKTSISKPPQPNDLDIFLSEPTSHSNLRKHPIALRQSPPEYPMTSVDQVLAWKKNGKRARLQGKDEVMKQLENRDQIFVVDDSKSMEKHWDDVVNTFTALSALVKEVDRNGIELYLTSCPEKRHQARQNETQSLIDILKRRKGNMSGSCHMEMSLGQIIGDIKQRIASPSRRFSLKAKAPKKISVYIFTDAVWDVPESELITCGVENPIESLVMQMKKTQRVNRTDVSLQFIRFGDSATGKKRLQLLDDGLGKRLNFDIVDHRFHRGNVWLMLIGSLSKYIDQIEDEGDDDAGEDAEKWKDKETG